MRTILSVSAILLSLAVQTFPTASYALGPYEKNLTLYYPNEGTEQIGATSIIIVKRVHPHIAIHVFAPTDGYMHLNHGLDDSNQKHYQSIVFTKYGKTYVTREPMPGRILPSLRLTETEEEMLRLQLSEIDRHGGVEPYVDLVLKKRGWFPPKK
ncbi:MAG: hypothetical protein NDI61_01295 [Bdellovibrionaceae bacterium]|nr:hypothetical protein [Pseudobdellovibrionaceae bacterium]